MSDTPSYQGKALGTHILRGQGSRRVPSRRYRRADGVESYYSSTSRRPAKTVNTEKTDAAADNIAVDDGVGSSPLGDLNQHGQTFKLPGSEITGKSRDHNPQPESEELADPNPTPNQRGEFNLLDSKNVEGETSSAVLAANLDQQNDEKFLFQPEVSNPVDEANSEGLNNMDGVESFSGSRRYERPWPRSHHEPGNHRSGYIPPSIAERISTHDEPVNPTNMNVVARLGLTTSVIQPSSAPVAEVEAGRTSSPSILSKPAEPSPLRPHVLPETAPYQHRRSLRRQPPAHRADLPDRPPPAALPHILMSGHSLRQEPDHIMRAARDIAMPAVAHVRNSTMDRELAFRRDVVAPRSGSDLLNTNYLQDGQLPPVTASYDGIISMHSYNTEAPLEPSTLESIYEDASDEPPPTTPMEEKPAERSYQKMTSSSFIGSTRNSGEYLGGKPPSFKPSMVSLDLPSSSTIKPTEREPDIRPSRKYPADKSQTISSSEEGLEKRLDEALYPAHKGHNVAVAVDTPQQQITGRVEARTRRSPIRRTSRYIQQDGSEGDGGIGKGDLRSRFEKVSYGSDRNGAMRFTPLVTSSLRSNDVDNMSRRMSGALPFTSAAPLPNKGVSNLESTEPEQGSDSLGDNVTLARPRDTGHSPESFNGARRKPIDPDYYYPFRDKPRRRPPYKRTFAVNMRKRATVIPRARERELSKERILRYIKEHNHPPIQPRRSSRAIRVPSRDDSQASDGLPASQYSERALRVHTSMDGAHEADDEMESEIEYITPRRKRKRANRRRRRISYEEAHHMHFLHGETENSGQIFEWPPHITQTRVRDDRGSNDGSDSSGTQRVYVTARTRQNRGAADISPADERLVTMAAGFSVALIMLLLCVYISFGPENRYYMSI
ncbi:hypothetical protein ACLOAV_005297 [Pseudogymnoascus australis]